MKKLAFVCIFLFCARTALAIDPFVINDVQVSGLERIEEGTLYNYLPLKVGDEVDNALARQSIKALMATGFFRTVALDKQGNVLVVRVQERPSISTLVVEGNKDISTDQIMEMLERAELTQGRILNERRLAEVNAGLIEAYFARGRYTATVEPVTEMIDDKRARLIFKIDEGHVARINEININGNEAYSDRKISKIMSLRKGRGLNPFSKRDLYSKQKFEGDLEKIRSYYTDRGYFDFDVTGSSVTISPEKDKIIIDITVFEGELFELGELAAQGFVGVTEEALDKAMKVKKGQIYSRKLISRIRSKLADELSSDGYGLARVDSLPQVNRETKTIDVVFRANAGDRVYVRRIEISGNSITKDEVIRRELRQYEGASFSSADIKRSQQRLRRLGHFESVSIDTVPIVGSPDVVDLDVKVTERSTGSFNFGLGYSDAEGALFQIGYGQRNFLGTGKQLDVTIDNSDVTDTYEFRYTNPYYTKDGISRGFHIKSRQVDSTEASTAEYISNSIEVGVDYKIPVSETNSFNFSLFAEQVDIESTSETPPEIQSFVDTTPDNTNYGTRISFSKDSLDDFIFPTKGALGKIQLESALPGSDLEYYKVNATASTYIPLGRGTSLNTTLKLGYGESYDENGLPFYKNYFAGGSSTVRGYDSRSLGPRDSGETPEPLGGNRRIIGSIQLLSPTFGAIASKDKRIGLFMDTGMVFSDEQSVDLNDLRYSAGVVFQWYSPVGPLSLSYAVPIDEEEGDEVEKFQISLGTLFR